jgi:hypothetical protein
MESTSANRAIAGASAVPIMRSNTASGQTSPPAANPLLAEATATMRLCLAEAEQLRFSEAGVIGRRAESMFNARLARKTARHVSLFGYQPPAPALLGGVRV